jgi:hypothetical protein
MKNSSSGEVCELVDLEPTVGKVGPVSHHWKCEPGNEESHDNLKKGSLIILLAEVFSKDRQLNTGSAFLVD